MGRLVELTRRQALVVLATAVACKRRDREAPAAPSLLRVAPVGYSHVQRLTGPRAQRVATAGGRLVMAEATDLLDASLETIRDAASVMRSAGGQLILVGANWNDEVVRRWSEAEWVAFVEQLAQVIGPSAVLFEPVSEPWVGDTERALRFFDLGRQHWPGTVIGPLSHPCDPEGVLRMIRRRELTVTDCTPVLASRTPHDQLRLWLREAVRLGTPLLLYDTFPSAGWNDGVVALIEEVLGE